MTQNVVQPYREILTVSCEMCINRTPSHKHIVHCGNKREKQTVSDENKMQKPQQKSEMQFQLIFQNLNSEIIKM